MDDLFKPLPQPERSMRIKLLKPVKAILNEEIKKLRKVKRELLRSESKNI